MNWINFFFYVIVLNSLTGTIAYLLCKLLALVAKKYNAIRIIYPLYLQEKYSFSRRRISCSLAKAISREKWEKGEILYELYHRFSLCDGNLSPYDSIQGIKLSDERH